MASDRCSTWVAVGLSSAVGAILLVLALLVAGNARAAVLHNQVAGAFPNSINSQDFETIFDDFDAMTADDFTVPPGRTWRLEEAFIQGKHNPTGEPTQATQARVTIFSDNAGLPGSEISSGVMSIKPNTYPNIRPILDPRPVLGAGTYWIGVQVLMNATDGGANARTWFWAENNTAFGNPAAYRNPLDGYGTGCTAFVPRSTCGTVSEPAHPAPDQSFNLSGTEFSSVPDTLIDSGPADGSTIAEASVAFGFSSAEAEPSFSCSVDGGGFAPCGSPQTLSGLSVGSHSFAVRVTNGVGITDPTPAARSFTVKSNAVSGPTPACKAAKKALAKKKMALRKAKQGLRKARGKARKKAVNKVVKTRKAVRKAKPKVGKLC